MKITSLNIVTCSTGNASLFFFSSFKSVNNQNFYHSALSNPILVRMGQYTPQGKSKIFSSSMNLELRLFETMQTTKIWKDGWLV